MWFAPAASRVRRSTPRADPARDERRASHIRRGRRRQPPAPKTLPSFPEDARRDVVGGHLRDVPALHAANRLNQATRFQCLELSDMYGQMSTTRYHLLSATIIRRTSGGTERTIYTHLAQIIGTPVYVSREQAELSGLDVDTRSDVHSLGVLLSELLTGTPPLGPFPRLRSSHLSLPVSGMGRTGSAATWRGSVPDRLRAGVMPSTYSTSGKCADDFRLERQRASFGAGTAALNPRPFSALRRLRGRHHHVQEPSRPRTGSDTRFLCTARHPPAT